ncbi:hypothetical protein TSUD_145470 [Trifolium subterraneum]|uniref:TF-B3 domain-containing protein n=1 Tax=Trifolium subterraneum TaxID=3900 RepID=A0A2Z6NG93_TRISU|nr:hypothetical protein TSUD_145470 [Trifolium subterraneum]
MTSGIDVGFTKPTTIILYFTGKGNKFEMYPAFGKNQTPSKPNIILVSSGSEEESNDDDDNEDDDISDDSDDDEDMENDNDDENMDNDNDDEDIAEPVVEDDESIDPTPFFTFDVKITEAMGTTKQVFHFPKKTAKYILFTNQTQIGLRDLETGRVFNCAIKTASRNINEKYIGVDWYNYKEMKILRSGDVVQCEIEDPPHFMNVNVVRRRGNRR